MPDPFLSFLRKEAERLDRALARALSADPRDEAEIASLRQQKRIVDDQYERWARDLHSERAAA
jgi:hypothetical protein